MSNIDHSDNLLDQIDFKTCLQKYVHESDLVETPLTALSTLNSPYLDCDEIHDHLVSGVTYSPKVMHLNIQSLPSKLNELKCLLNQLRENGIILDFILLCETFVGNDTCHLFSIPGYTLVTKNRQKMIRGGVAMYIRQCIPHKIIEQLSVFHEGEFESLFIETKIQDKRFIIGEIYRIPNTPEDLSVERFENVLNNLNETGANVIIGTDQNFDYLKIHSHNKTADLLNSFLSHELIPTITKPTRITHTSATLIDNIYVRQDSLISSAIIPSNISDHFPVVTFLAGKNKIKDNKTPLMFKYRPINLQAIDEIKQEIRNTDWTGLNNVDANNAYSQFIEKLNLIINTFAPEREVLIHPKNVIVEEWMTKGLMKSSYRLNRLYRKCVNKPKTDDMHTRYIEQRNLYNRLKRIAKKTYYESLFDQYKLDIKKTWKLMNSIIGKTNDKSHIQKVFNENNQIVEGPQNIADGFCRYFSNIGSKLADELSSSNSTYHNYLSRHKILNPSSFFLTPTTPDEVKLLIKSLKPKKSSGNDKLTPILIKQLDLEISYPLSVLINKSFSEGIVPDALKIAKVIPIHKAKERDQFSNYRPISILPVISKLYEKAMHKRLLNFMEKHDLLYQSQYGFRENHSTIMAVLELINKTIDSLDSKESVIAIFLDLSKAFDTINHKILLSKLAYYGVRGVGYEWMESYLSNRYQYVNYDNHDSTAQSLTCGVPQGSVLGPLLFIIYMNDLPHCLNKLKCLLFADDTSCYQTGKNLNQLYTDTNKELLVINDWFLANQLSLNITKSNYMVFTNTKNAPANQSIKIGNHVIERQTCVKFLGIHVDENLTWGEHTQVIKSKIASSIYAISRIKNIVPTSYKRTLYFTLVYPYLNYGITLWGSAAKRYRNKIFIMQKKAIRLICNAGYNDHTSQLFISQNVLKLDDIYKLEVSKTIHRFYNNILPMPLRDMFIRVSQIHDRQTRQLDNLHERRSRTALASRRMKHNGPILWNSLPRYIKESKYDTIKCFSSKLTKHLLSLMQS